MFSNYLIKTEFRPGYFIVPFITALFAAGLSFLFFYKNFYLGLAGSLVFFTVLIYYFTATDLSARRIYFFKRHLIARNIFTGKQILLAYTDIIEITPSREIYRDIREYGGKPFTTNYELKITTKSGDNILIPDSKYSNVKEIISFFEEYKQKPAN